MCYLLTIILSYKLQHSLPYILHFPYLFYHILPFSFLGFYSLSFNATLSNSATYSHRAVKGFPMLNSVLIFLSRSSPLSFATHSFRPSTTFSCTACCTSLQLQICTSVPSFTLDSRQLLSLNPLFRFLPTLPYLSLAHVSLISPLISLSSQYYSISIPSFLFLYSLQNFDLSILFQSCCIS